MPVRFLGRVITADNLVSRMLDPGLKLATSTPRADPSGDYAWEVFRRIEEAGNKSAFATWMATVCLDGNRAILRLLTGGTRQSSGQGALDHLYGNQHATRVFGCYRGGYARCPAYRDEHCHCG